MSVIPAADSLDLAPGVGQRVGSFRFELINGATGQWLGWIHPSRDSPPGLDHDTGRTIKRSIGGLQLDPTDSAAVNPVTDRVRLSYLASDGQSLPLGTYIFADSTRQRFSANSTASGALYDLMGVLDTPIETSFSARVGTSVGDAIRVLLEASDLTMFTVDGTSAVFGAPYAQPAGTSQAKILDDLAQLGGYFPAWMDNDSVVRVVAAFDPAERPHDFVYEAGGRIIDGSIAETNDLIKAPNRYIVIDSSNRDSALVGTYDVPASAPYSRPKRGFTVASVLSVQGLASQSQADATARTIGLGRTLFERVEFAAPPDPRHDSYDVIRYAGVNWLEVGWSMELIDGGSHRHRARKVYQ